jgi:hypothetical protein
MSRITVAEDVIAQGEPFYEDGRVAGWSSSPAFLIAADDADRCAAAVHAAGQRFYLINEHGREISDDEIDVGWNTPSWVSDVYLTDAGAVLFVDTKGDLTRLMGDAMVAVLVEELTARGVNAHIAALPRGFDPGERLWAPPAPPA